MSISRIFHITELLISRSKRRFYTIITEIKYMLYPGLKLGKGITYIGIPKFKNYPGGSIVIGDNCSFLSKPKSNMIGINRPCILSTQNANAKIIIGNNCGFSGTVIWAFKIIFIGNNVRCGGNTLIISGDAHNDDPRAGLSKEVIIEDNVWLGEGVKVLKGVRIGKNSVIGAGSIVVKDIPSNVVAVGNPCRVIRNL